MDHDTPERDPLDAMAAALAATDKAARAVAAALDYWTSMQPDTFRIPSSLLQKLDDYREAAAMMFAYLPTPGITGAQVERAFTQAQIDDKLVNYAIGLLTLNELAADLHIPKSEAEELVKQRVHTLSLPPRVQRAIEAEQAWREAQEDEPHTPVSVRAQEDAYGDKEDYVPADYASHEYR